jgi:hypothetical protein
MDEVADTSRPDAGALDLVAAVQADTAAAPGPQPIPIVVCGRLATPLPGGPQVWVWITAVARTAADNRSMERLPRHRVQWAGWPRCPTGGCRHVGPCDGTLRSDNARPRCFRPVRERPARHVDGLPLGRRVAGRCCLERTTGSRPGHESQRRGDSSPRRRGTGKMSARARNLFAPGRRCSCVTPTTSARSGSSEGISL